MKDLEDHLEKYSRSNDELQRMLKEQIQNQAQSQKVIIDTRDRVKEEEAQLASARSLESQRDPGRLDGLMYKRMSSIKHRDSGSEAHDLLGQVKMTLLFYI